VQLGFYQDLDTIAHRLHPAIKTVCLLLFFVVALQFTHPGYDFLVLLTAFALVAIAQAGRSVSRIRVFLVVLFAFSTLLWALLKPGHTPLVVWRFTVARESLLYGLGLGMRLDAMLIAGVVFLSCTTVEAFVAGLRALYVPFPVTFALGLAFRFVPTLFATTAKVVQAQCSRGLALDQGSLRARARRYVPLLVPIFVATLRNTNLLAMALEARAFSPGRPRTSVQEFDVETADWVILGVFLFLAGLSLGLKFAQVGQVVLGAA
jgi:energy-coupling factor transport system permease protein